MRSDLRSGRVAWFTVIAGPGPAIPVDPRIKVAQPVHPDYYAAFVTDPERYRIEAFHGHE